MRDDASPHTFVRLKAFLAEPEERVSWVIEGLLPSGGLSVLGAKPKVGKSTLARVMAHAVSTGTPCLGRKTNPGLVLYVSIEERRSDVRRHLKLLGSAGDPDLVIHVGPVPGTPKGASSREAIRRHRIAWLTTQLERFKPVLVVIDTFARFVALKDGNDYSEVTEASQPLIDLARSSGAHFAFTHHARKQDSELIDALVGSTGIVGAVDTVMLLRRHRDGTRTIESNQRVGDELEETVLHLDKATGTLSITGTLDDVRIETFVARCLACLACISPATEPDIRDRVTGDNEMLGKALRDAVRRGLVARTGEGKPGKPYVYSLSQARSETDKRDNSDKTGNIGKTGKSKSPVSPVSPASSGAESTDPAEPSKPAEPCTDCGEPGGAGFDNLGRTWCLACYERRCSQ
jgi:hypothetical protein